MLPFSIIGHFSLDHVMAAGMECNVSGDTGRLPTSHNVDSLYNWAEGCSRTPPGVSNSPNHFLQNALYAGVDAMAHYRVRGTMSLLSHP